LKVILSLPQREETRLDDYVTELKQWLRERFKEPGRKWQEPQILITGMNHDGNCIYIEFKLNFFVDDIKLENGLRAIALAVKFTNRWCDISNAASPKRLNLKRTPKL
jgi:hypothetical protein